MTDDITRLKIDKAVPGVTKKKRTVMLKIGAAGAVVLLLGLLFISGILSPAIPVEVTLVSKVYPSQTITLLNASGYVVPQRKAAVASKVTGRLVALMVEEGSRVKKGDILARLENDDAVAVSEQAAANLSVMTETRQQALAEQHDSELSFARNRELMEKGYVSRQEFDFAAARRQKAMAGVAGAEAGIRAARAALKGAGVAVEYALIRAPFDAVVLTKNADIGDIVTPLGAAANARASVVTLADMGSLQVEVDVAESNLSQVKREQPCEIQLDAFPEKRFRGRVHMIVPTADRTRATILVKVAFIDADARILPEMSAKVAFLQRPLTAEEESPRTAVNPGAVTERQSSRFVYLVKGEEAVEVQVTLGAAVGDMVEVLGGVKAGDKVLLRPTGKLKTGGHKNRIKIVEK
ncbi:MAG: efflux RND transporter periplasmic adaptor subunit [Thermodesulfovibrio sp.]|nr:efflux RND transporter periplasmic adaptor subunit [Thermodesulfovibrio sp.]